MKEKVEGKGGCRTLFVTFVTASIRFTLFSVYLYTRGQIVKFFSELSLAEVSFSLSFNFFVLHAVLFAGACI